MKSAPKDNKILCSKQKKDPLILANQGVFGITYTRGRGSRP